jgi:hypothetical protein
MFRRHKRSAQAKEEEEGKEGIPNFSGLDEDQEWKPHTRRSLRPFFELRTHQVRLLARTEPPFRECVCALIDGRSPDARLIRKAGNFG